MLMKNMPEKSIGQRQVQFGKWPAAIIAIYCLGFIIVKLFTGAHISDIFMGSSSLSSAAEGLIVSAIYIMIALMLK